MMTIAKVGGFVKNNTTGRTDRGGNIMNLVSGILFNLNRNDGTREQRTEVVKTTDDYGYALYRSLEYDLKYLKSDDFRFGESLLNTIQR